MAHMLFDALNGVSLDNHTVQSILDSTALSTAGPPTTITLDEEDVFQCGKCKKQFTSFSLFMCHKKEHTADMQNTSADASQEPRNAEATSYQQLEVQALDSSICASELCQPIILNEADILSFSIEDEALSITATAQPTTLASVQGSSSFLGTNTESPNSMKQLDSSTSNSVTNNFNITTISGQPIILSPQSGHNSFSSSALPNIQSLTSQGNLNSSPAISSNKNEVQNINILATYPEGHTKGCKVLLPNVDYIEECVENGTHFLDCDKAPDKLLEYGSASIDGDGTVLLDYCENDSRKTCKVLLTNGEYTETSIEYIDNADEICEYSSISGVVANDSAPIHETVAVSLLDVIHPSNTSSVNLDLSKAISEVVDSHQISVHENNLSIAIPNTSSSTMTSTVDPMTLRICDNSNNDCNINENVIDEKDNGRSSAPKAPKLKCHYCEKMFAKNFDLQQHLRIHTGEKPFQCVVCGRAFSQKSNVKKHMATHKVWPDGLSRTLPKEPLQHFKKCVRDDQQKKNKELCEDDGNNIIVIDRSYVCQYCNTPFTSYSELKTHMKKHSHQKVYKCVQHNCQKTFEDLDSFLKHSKLHTDEIQYCCHVCFKKFNTLADLGIHQYTHNPQNRTSIKNQRYFLCVKCKSKFTTSKALEHHLSTTNHNFPCTHCGKVFTCERYLRRHLPTHGAPESYVCPTCGKGFRTETYLNTHRLIHSGVKPYTCMHCPAAFNRKDKLARHSLIHQSIKKFKCPFHNYLGCSKEFNRQDKLKLHILTHSAVKPFHCRKCNKMFHKQTYLKEHERHHHAADAPFSCVQCGLRFKKKVHLSTHICTCEFNDAQDIINDTSPEEIIPEIIPLKETRSRRLRKIKCKKSPLKNSAGSVTEPKESTKLMATSINCNSGSGGDIEIDGDSVPTIEIIVMPMSVNHRKENEEKNGIYHVMFPSSSSSGEVQTKSVQSSLTSTFNNSSICVPGRHCDQIDTTCIVEMDEEGIGV